MGGGGNSCFEARFARLSAWRRLSRQQQEKVEGSWAEGVPKSQPMSS
jgi:hypothetical protein